MRNHQQTDPEDATLATLGNATFVRLDTTDCLWNEKDDHEWQNTTKLIRYGATFWRKIVPIKQVVAWSGLGDGPETMYVATFANQEDRDRAVREANERANKENN